MRFWWVNQNQTAKQEIAGGYMWSPKTSKGGRYNRYYENMREVAPGDIVFSFVDTRIHAIGVARDYCREWPKPEAFGTTGSYWDQIGWKVDVLFVRLKNQVRPKDYIDRLKPLLPAVGSPLQGNGNGIQSVYLAEIPEDFARELGDLIGSEFDQAIVPVDTILSLDETPVVETTPELNPWDEHLLKTLDSDPSIPDTERTAIVQSRVGQGLFKRRVMRLERRCRVTGVDRIEHLRASHCKPWRDSSNLERLDGENGLLLTPSIDHLFDEGFISFEDDGVLLVSPVAHGPSLQRMGVHTDEVVNVGSFSEGQRRYLEYHRDQLLLKRRAR